MAALTPRQLLTPRDVSPLTVRAQNGARTLDDLLHSEGKEFGRKINDAQKVRARRVSFPTLGGVPTYWAAPGTPFMFISFNTSQLISQLAIVHHRDMERMIPRKEVEEFRKLIDQALKKAHPTCKRQRV